MHIIINIFVLLATFFAFKDTFARPEYAAKLNVNRCTMCHVSPVGGGVKNIVGKAFGSHGFTPRPYEDQDLISLDARAVYFMPEKTSPPTRGGLAWMAGIVGANAPLTGQNDPQELRLVYSHNLSGFTTDSEFYLRFRLLEENSYEQAFQYISMGRMHIPFGYLTDEHRTYTKLQTQTTWNDFAMGVMISGDSSTQFHYDFLLLNGENSDGTMLSSDNGHRWGGIINLRYASTSKPYVLGTSYLHRDRASTIPSAWAGSLYAHIPFNRFSSTQLPLNLTVEYVRARYLNSSLQTGLIDTSSTYDETIAESESEGILLLLNYEITNKSAFTLKYDQLVLDKSFQSDALKRYGIGYHRFLLSNVKLLLRYDISSAGHPSQERQVTQATTDAFYAILQIGL